MVANLPNPPKYSKTLFKFLLFALAIVLYVFYYLMNIEPKVGEVDVQEDVC